MQISINCLRVGFFGETTEQVEQRDEMQNLFLAPPRIGFIFAIFGSPDYFAVIDVSGCVSESEESIQFSVQVHFYVKYSGQE